MSKIMKKVGSNFALVEAGYRTACNRPMQLQLADLSIQRAEGELQLGRWALDINCCFFRLKVSD